MINLRDRFIGLIAETYNDGGINRKQKHALYRTLEELEKNQYDRDDETFLTILLVAKTVDDAAIYFLSLFEDTDDGTIEELEKKWNPIFDRLNASDASKEPHNMTEKIYSAVINGFVKSGIKPEFIPTEEARNIVTEADSICTTRKDDIAKLSEAISQ